MRLKTKIISLVLLLVVAPILSLGIISYNYLRDSESEKIIRQIQSSLEHIERSYNTRKQIAEANTDLFSQHSIVLQYALTESEEIRYDLLYNSLMVQFARFHKAFPDYHKIRFILPDGTEDAVWSSSAIGDDDSDIPFFDTIAAADRDTLSGIYKNDDTQRISLYTSKRLTLSDPTIDPYGKNPKLRGYLTLSSSLASLSEQIYATKIGKTGQLVIADNEGKILVQPQQKKNATAARLNQIPVSAIKTKKSGDRFTSSVIKLRGQDILVNGLTLSDQFHLLALLPEQELIMDSRKVADFAFLIMVVAIVIAVSLSIWVLHKIIINPIQVVHDATHRLAKGELSDKIPVSSTDEVGELARAFEKMAQSLKQSNEQISRLAYHDSLTGLPNRRMFQEFLIKKLADAKRHNRTLAVLFLDLDDFKRVNDILGHQAGDQLLQEFAKRLASCIRAEDYLAQAGTHEASDQNNVVARLGGDEFIILLNNLQRDHNAAIVADRILQSLKDPFTVLSNELHMNTSIGITVYPDDAQDEDTLIKNADIAMYHAKNRGKMNYQFFSDAMNQNIQNRFSMETRLRKALQQEEFVLHYQPQIDMVSGRICGIEALIRWNDPDEGMISPDRFIHLAEESGLIIPITEWVIDTACRQNLQWQNQGLPQIPVSVNVSGVQLSRKEAAKHIIATAQATGLPLEWLMVEITESVFLEYQADSIQNLIQLRQADIAIALDDFGTGHSAISYLKQFPIQILKVDRSFINKINNNKADATIIASIIAMAHAMGLKVVAEGVESQQQYLLLRGLECDYVQGYYLSKPLPAPKLSQWLMENWETGASQRGLA